MKDIITLYNDGDREIIYFCRDRRVSYIHGDSTNDYEEYELFECQEHIMSTIKDKRYADCICECLSALINDWFDDYIQMPIYTDIKMYILQMNK